MSLYSFIKEVVASFNPFGYEHISHKGVRKSVNYLLLILLLAFFIAGVFSVPKLFDLKDYFDNELSKFSELKLGGKINMTSPIYLPLQDTKIIIDTTGTHTEIGKEKLLITKDKIHYRPYKKVMSMSTDVVKDLGENKDKISQLAVIVFLLILPSFIIAGYVLLFLKYLIIVLLSSLIIYFLLDLTEFRQRWRKTFAITAHAVTIMVLIEVLSVLFSTRWLVPMFSVFGVNFYLVSLILFLILTMISLAMVIQKSGGS